MENTGARRGAGGLASYLTAVCVAAVLLLGGCARGGTASAPAGTPSPPPPTSAAPAPGRPTAGCNADYCEPADWDTGPASTPLPQVPRFVEPLNVVIGARSTVSLTAIQQALGRWKTVSTATTVNLTGIHLNCISSETADVTGSGYRAQQAAWRLGGCVDGNGLSLRGNEDHARIWHQPVAGSRYGAWFIAVSYETLCLVKSGKLRPASTDLLYAALHPGSAYHCVDGGPGSIAAAHPDGYDDAAADFAAAIVAAAGSRGWHVSRRTVSVKRGASAGEDGVPFGPTVHVLTVTS